MPRPQHRPRLPGARTRAARLVTGSSPRVHDRATGGRGVGPPLRYCRGERRSVAHAPGRIGARGCLDGALRRVRGARLDGALRRPRRRARRLVRRARARGDGVHRPVRLRQDDDPAHPQPHERPRAGSRGRGLRALPRQRPLRARRRRGRGAPAHRDGLPASPTPSRARSATTSPSGRARSGSRATSTSASSARCARPRSGTRSRIASAATPGGSRAVSSSASASPAAWRSSPRCC